MLRPAIFLDTNICSDVAKQVIAPHEWIRVWRHIQTEYRYCISYVTLSELFVKLARGKQDYFTQNKHDLRTLYGHSGRRVFLDYPPAFATKQILGKSPVLPGKEPIHFQQWLRAVLRTPSKEALLYGIRRPNSTRRADRFDLDDFEQFETREQAAFTDILEGLRGGEIDRPQRQKMAAWMLQNMGLTPFSKDCAKLAEALDAHHRYAESVARFANNRNYNFQRRASNYQDCLQLAYLCDESMHFLTQDGDFQERTKGSPQANRILLYKEFSNRLLTRT